MMQKKIFTTILISIFVIFSFFLGTWQLEKHNNQKKTTAKILTKNMEQLKKFNSQDANFEKHVFEEITLQGRWDYSNIQYARNIIKYGVKGKNILIPFRINNNINVLVNKGWAPEELIQKTTNLIIEKNNNETKGRIFIPINDKAKKLSNGDWFGISTLSISNQLPYDLASWMIIEGAQIKNNGSYERYTTMPKNFPVHEDIIINNGVFHIGYAFTWFSFVFLGLFGIIYVHRN